MSTITEEKTIPAKEELEKIVQNPPKGMWIREENGNIVIGSSLHTASSLFLLLFLGFLFFMVISLNIYFLSQGALDSYHIYRRIILVDLALCGLFLRLFLYSIANFRTSLKSKFEFSVGKESYVIKKPGKKENKEYIDWYSVEQIYHRITQTHDVSNGITTDYNIVMEGNDGKEIVIPNICRKKNQKIFLLSALQYINIRKHEPQPSVKR